MGAGADVGIWAENVRLSTSNPWPSLGGGSGEGQPVGLSFLPAWPGAPVCGVPSPIPSSAACSAFLCSLLILFYFLFYYVALVAISPSNHFLFLQIFQSFY